MRKRKVEKTNGEGKSEGSPGTAVIPLSALT